MKQETLKILVVEDNPVDVLRLKAELERETDRFAISQAESLDEAKGMLRNETYQLILLDLGLPDSQGMETLIEIQNFAPGIPVVVLSGRDDEILAVEAVAKGAQDYLAKDRLDSYLIVRCLNYAIERHRILKARRETLAEIRKLNEDLERRVKERTAELKTANENLLLEIAERKSAEKAYKESEEKYRLVVESANEAIMVAQDGILQFVNPRSSEILGYSEEELTSKRFAELVHSEDVPAVTDLHEKILRGELVPNVFAFRIIEKSGNIKWVEANTILISWQGAPAVLIFQTDVTAKRRIEDELLKIQKLESIGVLAGGIAHDFNNILTAILGNLSLAKSESHPEDRIFGRLDEAEKACLRAKGLTLQLLTFSKGGAPIRKTTSLPEIIRDSCEFALRGSDVRSEFSLIEDLWTAEVDAGQISQVISNLVINANQAMPQGGILRVQGENVVMRKEDGFPLPEGEYIRISLTDEGVGISPDHLPKIFDPYFTTKQRGSGLGLATTYSIVKNHGGLITVVSEEEMGTTFQIYLPASEEAKGEQHQTEGDLEAGSGNILLMDDEEQIRHLTGEMLRMLGYQVEEAKDGTEAIRLYQQAKSSGRPFDIVILDLTVAGGMGGRQAMQRLSEIDPYIQAIVSSGYSNDPVMADYAKYGFVGVVPKPYDMKEIARTLKRVIGGLVSRKVFDEPLSATVPQPSRVEKRQSPRYLPFFSVRVVDSRNPGNTGKIKDVSDEGLGVIGMEASIGEVKNIVVLCDDLGTVESFEVKAECRWVTSNDDRESNAGFHIMQISARDLARLRELIKTIPPR